MSCSNVVTRINTEYGIYLIEYLYSSIGFNDHSRVLSLTLHFPSKCKLDNSNRRAAYGFITIEDSGKISFYSAATFKDEQEIQVCKNVLELYISIASTHTLIDQKALDTLFKEAKRQNCKFIE